MKSIENRNMQLQKYAKYVKQQYAVTSIGMIEDWKATLILDE